MKYILLLSYLTWAQIFDHSLQMESYWVECSTDTCRAQYVVEDAKNLRVGVPILVMIRTYMSLYRSDQNATIAATVYLVHGWNALVARTESLYHHIIAHCQIASIRALPVITHRKLDLAIPLW